MDFAFALLCLPVATVAILLLVIVIRLDSPGAALFRQQRLGKDEREFTLFKLRTMAIHTVDQPSHEADRAKITRAGRVLRRLKLDELPQLYNVLTGSMSLVGPRPCLPSQSELRYARRELGVFKLRPGVTGLAQIEGVDMSTPRELAEKDAEYLVYGSLTGDIGILARTFSGRGRGDAANK